MEYDEFFARYRPAYESWSFGRMDRAAAARELAGLRALVPSIEPSRQRELAGYLLDQWEAETSPEAIDRTNRATAALARASRDGGTEAERIDRARAGIAEITRIADEATDPAERQAIAGMTELLAMIIDALEPDSR